MIDIRKIRDTRPDLTNAKLAELFFSDHKHPERALARLLSDPSKITEGQMQILASYLGVKAQDLFTEDGVGGWIDKSECGKDLTLQKGRYTARFNSNKGQADLYCEHERIDSFLVSKTCPIGDFLERLDQSIREHEEQDLL